MLNMNSVKKYCFFASILWINGCSADENICGQLEVQNPTILGRNITFIFTPNNKSSMFTAEWQRVKTRQWNSLPNNNKFVQYTEGGRYYLMVTNTSGIDGDLLYRTILRTRDLNCTSQNESLKLIDLTGDCGLIYLRSPKSLNLIQDGDKVEIGYFPAPAVINFTDYYIREWRRTSENFVADRCALNLTTGEYEERSVSNHEYVLTLVSFKAGRSNGTYIVRCTDKRSNDKFTNDLRIYIPVPPSQPVFGNLSDIDSCVNCIVGEDGQQIMVVCNTTGGSQPVNVSLTIYNKTFEPEKDQTGAYNYSFYLRNQYHMNEAVCSVTNDALDKPLTATAVVYVTKPPVMESFNVPNITKEGEPINISCVYMGGRPLARVFLRIGGEEIHENVAYRNHTDAESLLTSATLTKFRKEWNNRRVSCCRSNPHYIPKTLCTESNPVQYKFPPESVTVTSATYRIDDQDYYLVRSNCTIHNASPACKPQWIVPNNLFFDGKFLINKITGDPDGGIDSLWEASFNVSALHSGQLVVCRAVCRDFNVTTKGSFNISIPEGEGHERTVEKHEGSAPSWITPVVVAVSLVAIVVVAVVVIVVRRMKNDKAVITENEAYEPFDAVRTTKPQRGNDESVPLQEDVLYSQVNKPKASDDLVTFNSQPAGEPQLVYAELAVGPPSQQNTSTSGVRRDSPTEYVGIDFAKTAEQQCVEKETVYANQ